MVIQNNCNFITNATSPTISYIYPNANSDILTLSISGNEGLYYLEGRGDSNHEWITLAGVNVSDFSVAKDGFVKPGVYEIGIIGIRQLRVKVERTSGAVSITGQMISSTES